MRDLEDCSKGTPVDITDDSSVYITACYWVISTLTTVGYGDYKGYTSQEYGFQMIVEFLGIGTFSWLMGSINTMVTSDNQLQDILDSRMEDVDVWIRNMENARTKNFGKLVFNSIKRYTELAFTHDFSNLQKSEFFAQLKPRIRYKLLNTLFSPFISNFFYLFNDDDFEGGCEFTCEFLSNIKPKLFLSDNIILDYGENCDCLYMIYENVVSLHMRIDKAKMYKETN